MSRWFLAATWLVVLPLIALNLRAEDKPSAAAQNSGSDQTAIEKALAEKTKVEFIEVPLSDAVEVLAKKHAIQIVIDHDALKYNEFGGKRAETDWLIIVQLSDVSLRAALNLILRDFGLAWTVRDGALLITTQNAAKKILFTKRYPVEDIVAGRDERGNPTDGSKSLVECVTELFALDYYRKIEGASVRIIDTQDGKALSITHNRWVHEDAADLLDLLRSALPKDKPAKRKPTAEDKIKAALKKQTSLNYTNVPLETVVEDLKDKHKIEIQFDYRKVYQGRFYPDTPVTVNVKGISLQSALSIILKEIELTYVIRDEVLLITNVELEDITFDTRVYDVTDLVASHDESGNVRIANDGLMWFVFNFERYIENYSVARGSAGFFSNGGVHLLVVRRDTDSQKDIAWTLKEIRRIGQRDNVAPPTTAGEDEQKPRQPKKIATVLPGEEVIQKALARKVSLDFDDKPLREIIDALKNKLKIEIQLHNREWRGSDLSGDTRVTINVSGITFRDALREMLKPLDLWWTVRDGALFITTREENEWMSVIKVYAVADLPDSLLPLETEYPHIHTRSVVSSDTVRALVVIEPYHGHEKIVAWLAAARDPKKRHLLEKEAQKALKANVKDLKHTIITPHLKQAIPKDTNVLWCSTFQLAWNELCELAGGPIKMENPPEMVAILNRKEASKDDLDEESYVAAAGLALEGIYEKIQKQLQEKFKGKANTRLFEKVRQRNMEWVTYAHLYKQLPFRWAFTRFDDKLRFADKRVDSFGIEQLLNGLEDEAKMASQVGILDFKDPDDFIIELKTQAIDDRLILAKIASVKTLEETVAAVEKRIAGKKPTQMEEMTDLDVPVLDFDLLREYDELCGKPLQTKNQEINGSPIVIAAQSVRFRLDETGAVLESEGVMAGGMSSKNLVFDKPFLILLKRRGAKRPYFALWVGNAELMVESSYP